MNKITEGVDAPVKRSPSRRFFSKIKLPRQNGRAISGEGRLLPAFLIFRRCGCVCDISGKGFRSLTANCSLQLLEKYDGLLPTHTLLRFLCLPAEAFDGTSVCEGTSSCDIHNVPQNGPRHPEQ